MSDAQVPSQFANAVGGFVVLFLCVTMGYLTYSVVNEKLSDTALNLVIYILGFITGKLSSVVDWRFGTTSASKAKDDTIATLTATASDAQSRLPAVAGAVPVVPVAAGDAVMVKADEPKS